MCSPLQQSTIYIYILEQYGESTAIDEQLITYITIGSSGGNVAVIHTYISGIQSSHKFNGSDSAVVNCSKHMTRYYSSLTEKCRVTLSLCVSTDVTSTLPSS